MLHKLYERLRAATPSFVHDPIRRGATAILTPLRFAFATGHFRSSLNAAAFDAGGGHLPWYTYPAIDFLSNGGFADKRILEFGAGHSTIWWGKRAQHVLALEEDERWYEKLKPLVPANVTLHLVPTVSETPPLLADRRFDVVIVDGFWRLRAAEIGIKHLANAGVIIVDDAECHWGPNGGYPIMDLLRSSRFTRVDFYGFAPGTAHRKCTSIAFRSKTFLFDGNQDPKALD